MNGERIYARNDMALAWQNGYRDGVEAGVWNYTHEDMIASGLRVRVEPYNPYAEE